MKCKLNNIQHLFGLALKIAKSKRLLRVSVEEKQPAKVKSAKVQEVLYYA